MCPVQATFHSHPRGSFLPPALPPRGGKATPHENKRAWREGDEHLEATRSDFSSPKACGDRNSVLRVRPAHGAQLLPEVLGRPHRNPQPGPHGLLAQSPPGAFVTTDAAVQGAESPRTSVSGSQLGKAGCTQAWGEHNSNALGTIRRPPRTPRVQE